jgi:hypothetical protein
MKPVVLMESALSETPKHLSDAEMKDFIREGYVTLQSELPREFHEHIYQCLEPLDEQGPVGHNNLLPCVPELRDVLDEPAIRGALESILGPGYFLHFHRHDHVNLPDAAQPLHKDGDNHSHYAMDGFRRDHHTRFAMLFYYPQDTAFEKGPTGIVPRSQYTPRFALESKRREMRALAEQAREEVDALVEQGVHAREEARALSAKRYEALVSDHPELTRELEKLDEPWERRKIPLVGGAGSVTIVHFDIAHGRYSGNLTDAQRHMVKFLFTRQEDPTTPSWAHETPTWLESEDAQEPIWQHMWRWHLGRPEALKDDSQPLEELVSELESGDDVEAISAAYALAAHGEPAVAPLMERFCCDDVVRRTVAAYGVASLGEIAVPHLLKRLEGADESLTARIADVLGDIGPPAKEALPALVVMLTHSDPLVRRYAAEAIGIVGQGVDVAPSELVMSLRDDDALTRRNAELAIARLGSRAAGLEGLVEALRDNLYHDHHHVRGWAIEALQRVGDADAMVVVLRYLQTARWDYQPRSGDRRPPAPVNVGAVYRAS